MQKSTILSAIQPSSILHLGNYLGAVRNWLKLQREYECYFFACDLHSITQTYDPEKLREYTYKVIALYLASGIDPDEAILFCQSHVPEHAELAWILTCTAYMGELSRMTQFKDKSQKQGVNIGAGLFCYPALMAADILLYQTNLVPVGDDQKQHLELTRDLAERFNNRFNKKIFTIPEVFIAKSGARIMDLQIPTNKMSKSSNNEQGTLFLTDTDKQIQKKIKSAVTDSGSTISYEEGSAGIKNLFQIYSALTEKSFTEIEDLYRGKMYGHLKVDLADIVIQAISPIREKAEVLLNDRAELDRLLRKGGEKARLRASQTLKKVYEVSGFIPKI